jgi:hypothetical protein
MSPRLLNGAMPGTLGCSQQRGNNRYTHYHRGKPKLLANTQERPELDYKTAHIGFPLSELLPHTRRSLLPRFALDPGSGCSRYRHIGKKAAPRL